MPDFVAYFRVSTQKQGADGLGMEAQREAVSDYAKKVGARILQEFVEVESGKKTERERPELALAMGSAKRTGATLVVAKLDRLARNVAFLSSIMQTGVNFLACDNPHATKFTVHILAAVAELEREQISRRTKEALARAKARGTKLGSARPGHWDGREEIRLAAVAKARKRASEVISAKARAEYADLLPQIGTLRAEGLSLRAVAKVLNDQGHRTRRGKEFRAVQVRAILCRSAADRNAFARDRGPNTSNDEGTNLQQTHAL